MPSSVHRRLQRTPVHPRASSSWRPSVQPWTTLPTRSRHRLRVDGRRQPTTRRRRISGKARGPGHCHDIDLADCRVPALPGLGERERDRFLCPASGLGCLPSTSSTSRAKPLVIQTVTRRDASSESDIAELEADGRLHPDRTVTRRSDTPARPMAPPALSVRPASDDSNVSPSLKAIACLAPYRVKHRSEPMPYTEEGMDTDLVESAQHGDKGAFTTLAAAVADRFLATSHRILRDLSLAEDATQQALLTVWQDLPQLRDPARFDAWSYRILVRACYAEAKRSCADGRRTSTCCRPMSRWRRTGSARSSIATSSSAASDGSPSIIERWWSCTTTSTCRSTRLPRSLGIPAGTVASRLHYAMRGLRAALDADARMATGGRDMSVDRDVTRAVRSWLHEDAPLRTPTACSISFSISWTRAPQRRARWCWRGGSRP